MAETLSGLVEPAMTFAPACANPSAIARPIPLVPPVTRQTLPVMSSGLYMLEVNRFEVCDVELEIRFLRDRGERVDLRRREKEPAELFALLRRARLGLAGKHHF